MYLRFIHENSIKLIESCYIKLRGEFIHDFNIKNVRHWKKDVRHWKKYFL